MSTPDFLSLIQHCKEVEYHLQAIIRLYPKGCKQHVEFTRAYNKLMKLKLGVQDTRYKKKKSK